jgi:hypothetical protein
LRRGCARTGSILEHSGEHAGSLAAAESTSVRISGRIGEK